MPRSKLLMAAITVVALLLSTTGVGLAYSQTTAGMTFTGPDTHSSCVDQPTSDTVTITGVGSNTLQGYIDVQYVTDTGRQEVQTYSINQTGDLTLQVAYPPVSQWPVLTTSTPPGTREIHVVVNINAYSPDGTWLALFDGIQGGTNLGWDVYCNGATLGDFVWSDTNGNGLQDANEPGIPNVPVTLYTCDGAMVASMTTDATGHYLFIGLLAGCYVVQFSPPGGYAFSPQYAGGDSSYQIDSNANPTTGQTGQINLNSGDVNLTIDAGMIGSTPGPVCTNAPANYPNLGAAAGFTVFALNGSGTKQSANFSNDTITGDVGVASGATVSNQAPSTTIGDVYVDSGGKFSGPGKVKGTIFTSQDLASARADAINASSQAAALTPNFTFGDITTNTTVNGVSGLNVVAINGKINLNNASLTLSGPSDAFFVVNVSGAISLVGTGGIQVGGNVSASHLIINMTGSGNLLQTHIGNVVQGTVLGPNVGGSLDGAFGSLLLGQNFSLMSGVKVTYGGCE